MSKLRRPQVTLEKRRAIQTKALRGDSVDEIWREVFEADSKIISRSFFTGDPISR